jgi:hypothetical protein
MVWLARQQVLHACISSVGPELQQSIYIFASLIFEIATAEGWKEIRVEHTQLIPQYFFSNL